MSELKPKPIGARLVLALLQVAKEEGMSAELIEKVEKFGGKANNIRTIVTGSRNSDTNATGLVLYYLAARNLGLIVPEDFDRIAREIVEEFLQIKIGSSISPQERLNSLAKTLKAIAREIGQSENCLAETTNLRSLLTGKLENGWQLTSSLPVRATVRFISEETSVSKAIGQDWLTLDLQQAPDGLKVVVGLTPKGKALEPGTQMILEDESLIQDTIAAKPGEDFIEMELTPLSKGDRFTIEIRKKGEIPFREEFED